jgi:hypothetical protein
MRTRPRRKEGGWNRGWGQRVHAQSVYARHQWQSSSMIAINRVQSPPLFVTTNHFHSRTLPSAHHHHTMTTRGDAMSLTAERVPAASTALGHPNSAQRHVAVTIWHINGTLQTCHNVYVWQSMCNRYHVTLPLRMHTRNGNSNPALSLCRSRRWCNNATNMHDDAT